MTPNVRPSLKDILAEKLKAKAAELNTGTLSLEQWARKYCPSRFYRQGCALHIKLIERLGHMTQHRDQKEVFQAPRGYAKTTWATFAYPLKCICERTERYIIVCSDSSDMADAYLKDIADELLHNEQLRKDYPSACRQGSIWNTDTIITGNDVCVMSLGKGKNARGRKYNGIRPTLILVDDPQDNEDCDSARGRERDMAWVDRALVPCGDAGTNYLFIGNNLHRQSIIGTLSNRSDYNLTKFASIVKWPDDMNLWDTWETLYIAGNKNECSEFYAKHKDAMLKGSEVLWPEKETLLDLMTIRAPNHAAFEAEKQNNPRDPSRSEFDELWFEDTGYTNLPDAPRVTVSFTDPSKGSESRKGDYTAIITLHYYPSEGRAYIEADIKRRPLATLIDTMFNIAIGSRHEAFAVETNGFQQLLASELQDKCEELGTLLNVLPIEHYGVKKAARISRLSVWLRRKFFKFKMGCRDTELLLAQLLDHPNADHDDGPDALEAALRTLTNYCDIGAATMAAKGESALPFDDGAGDNIFGSMGVEAWL